MNYQGNREQPGRYTIAALVAALAARFPRVSPQWIEEFVKSNWQLEIAFQGDYDKWIDEICVALINISNQSWPYA